MVAPPIPVADEMRSPSARAAEAGAARVCEWDVSDIGVFKPERWLVARADGTGVLEFDPAAGPMMAFGGGPRGCVGRRLAYMQLRVVVSVLIWHLEFLDLPEELRDYGQLDVLTTLPRMAHVKPRKVELY